MEFETADYNWDDFHTGLTPKRRRRYGEVLNEILERTLAVLAEHHGPYSIQAQAPAGIFAAGVRGDNRMYAPIVLLFSDAHLEDERLRLISTGITNRAPVSHVIYCLTRQIPSNVIDEARAGGVEVLLSGEGNDYLIITRRN